MSGKTISGYRVELFEESKHESSVRVTKETTREFKYATTNNLATSNAEHTYKNIETLNDVKEFINKRANNHVWWVK